MDKTVDIHVVLPGELIARGDQVARDLEIS